MYRISVVSYSIGWFACIILRRFSCGLGTFCSWNRAKSQIPPDVNASSSGTVCLINSCPEESSECSSRRHTPPCDWCGNLLIHSGPDKLHDNEFYYSWWTPVSDYTRHVRKWGGLEAKEISRSVLKLKKKKKKYRHSFLCVSCLGRVG